MTDRLKYFCLEGNFVDSYKLDNLADILNISHDKALSIIVKLFAFVSQNCPTGDISKYKFRRVSEKISVKNRPEKILKALLECGSDGDHPDAKGFLEYVDGKLIIHDWLDHQPYARDILKRREKYHKLSGNYPETIRKKSGEVTEKLRAEKSRVEKNRVPGESTVEIKSEKTSGFKKSLKPQKPENESVSPIFDKTDFTYFCRELFSNNDMIYISPFKEDGYRLESLGNDIGVEKMKAGMKEYLKYIQETGKAFKWNNHDGFNAMLPDMLKRLDNNNNGTGKTATTKKKEEVVVYNDNYYSWQAYLQLDRFGHEKDKDWAWWLHTAATPEEKAEWNALKRKIKKETEKEKELASKHEAV